MWPAALAPAGPVATTIGQLILHVFDKFPTLKFYFAETNGGWLAHYFNWLDELLPALVQLPQHQEEQAAQ